MEQSSEQLIAEITKWQTIYEFTFQFWGPGQNNVFIEKGSIRMTDFGGCETPKEAMTRALEWVNKQNPRGFKEPETAMHYCIGCGSRVAPGNDLCGECMCEDDSDF